MKRMIAAAAAAVVALTAGCSGSDAAGPPATATTVAPATTTTSTTAAPATTSRPTSNTASATAVASIANAYTAQLTALKVDPTGTGPCGNPDLAFGSVCAARLTAIVKLEIKVKEAISSAPGGPGRYAQALAAINVSNDASAKYASLRCYAGAPADGASKLQCSTAMLTIGGIQINSLIGALVSAEQ